MATVDATHRVGIVGIGTLGVTIVQLVLDCGDRAIALTRPGATERAERAIHDSLMREVRAGRLAAASFDSVVARLTITDDSEMLRGCDVVVESIVENVEAKQDIIARIESVVAADTPIVSSTSTIPASTLSDRCRHPERVLVAHYVWPANRVRLVEVTTPERASDASRAALERLLERQGKVVVRTADQPGFLITRVLFGYLAETVALIGEGRLPSAIDAAMELAGWPTGPCKLMDRTSITSVVTIADLIVERLDGRADELLLLRALLDHGFDGVRSGLGLYDHRQPHGQGGAATLVDHAAAIGLIPRRPPRPGATPTRLADALVSEVAWCIGDGVVDTWESAAEAIDNAYGFPGGLIDYVDNATDIVDRLGNLDGPRSHPNSVLVARTDRSRHR